MVYQRDRQRAVVGKIDRMVQPHAATIRFKDGAEWAVELEHLEFLGKAEPRRAQKEDDERQRARERGRMRERFAAKNSSSATWQDVPAGWQRLPNKELGALARSRGLAIPPDKGELLAALQEPDQQEDYQPAVLKGTD